jgi:hypothetical protein
MTPASAIVGADPAAADAAAAATHAAAARLVFTASNSFRFALMPASSILMC